ncbi:MAG: 3-deoxy-7-phosphoheptulonate synthase [Deferrisomatales bacterium]
MILVLRPGHREEDRAQLRRRLEARGLSVHESVGARRTVLGAIGDEEGLRDLPLASMPGVERVIPILKPYQLVSREFQPDDTVVTVKGVAVGGPRVQVIAGPCSVESRESLFETAWAVKEAGATLLRGGAFKPRTSPYAFQGLGEAGLELLAEAGEATGLPVVTELLDPRDAALVARYADVVQIGARNMQNFRLLQEVGAGRKPVLLKRGLAATVLEWLMSAEYVAAQGNRQILLCERGIRTFETVTRSTLDLAAVPVLKGLTHLPVLVDPSHAAGRYDLVGPLARAAVAAGADGLLIEVHVHPGAALCDGDQSLTPGRFAAQMAEYAAVARAVGRDLGVAP